MRRKGVFLSAVFFLSMLCGLIASLFLSMPSAFASGGKGPSSHQRGGFIHLATEAQPAGVAPLCSGWRCNGKNPYSMNCAGQSWDSWWVVATGSIVDSSGTYYGYVQLWYSANCATNWGRVVVQRSGTYQWVDNNTTLTNGTGASESFYPPFTLPEAWVGPQVYAPVLLACTNGILGRNGNPRIAGGYAMQPGWSAPGFGSHC